MPAPCRKTAAGSFGSKVRPPVPARTRLPATLNSMRDLLRRPWQRLLRGPERLRQVFENVVGLPQPHREPDHVLADPRGGELLGAQLLVRGAGGMDHQGLGIADVGE